MKLLVFGSGGNVSEIKERDHLYKLLRVNPTGSLYWMLLVDNSPFGFDVEGGKHEIIESLPLDKMPNETNIKRAQKYFEDKYRKPVSLTIYNDVGSEFIESAATIDQDKVRVEEGKMLDDDGNSIWKEEDTFYLKKVDDKRKKKIGAFNRKTGRLLVHQTGEDGVFLFPYLFLSLSNTFHTIELYSKGGQWLVPKQYVISNGHFAAGIDTGLARHIVVTSDQLKTYSTNG